MVSIGKEHINIHCSYLTSLYICSIACWSTCSVRIHLLHVVRIEVIGLLNWSCLMNIYKWNKQDESHVTRAATFHWTGSEQSIPEIWVHWFCLLLCYSEQEAQLSQWDALWNKRHSYRSGGARLGVFSDIRPWTYYIFVKICCHDMNLS